MSESTDEIARLFHALNQHSELIAQAFSGAIELGDRSFNQRINTLSNLKALKPQEEGVYRLNPRLREYVSDYLVSYRAYQTLTRLSGPIHQARALWREMSARRDAGEMEGIESLEDGFSDTVGDIAFAIEGNLSLLHSLVSTQYGDVSSFKAKLRQNKYYINEINESLNEMKQVSALFDAIEREAMVYGLVYVRATIRKRLTNRLLTWTSQIKDAQATINRSFFRARRLEERVRKLSRVSHWLRQNKTAAGFEVTLDGVPDTLFRADPMTVRAHVDVRSARDADHAILLDAINRLPPRPVAIPVAQPAPPLTAIEEEVLPEVEPLEPHDAMLEELIAELQATSHAISLLNWKRERQEFDSLSDEGWLLYASIQLENEGIRLTFVSAEGGTTQFANEVSNDVIAQGMA